MVRTDGTYSGRCLIEDQQFAPAYDCSSESDDLSLSHRQVSASARDDAIQRQAILNSAELYGRPASCSHHGLML